MKQAMHISGDFSFKTDVDWKLIINFLARYEHLYKNLDFLYRRTIRCEFYGYHTLSAFIRVMTPVLHRAETTLTCDPPYFESDETPDTTDQSEEDFLQDHPF